MIQLENLQANILQRVPSATALDIVWQIIEAYKRSTQIPLFVVHQKGLQDAIIHLLDVNLTKAHDDIIRLILSTLDNIPDREYVLHHLYRLIILINRVQNNVIIRTATYINRTTENKLMCIAKLVLPQLTNNAQFEVYTKETFLVGKLLLCSINYRNRFYDLHFSSYIIKLMKKHQANE